MKKLVIIGAGEFQLPLIKKANKLGYETHVFAWDEGAVGKKYASFFYPISIIEKDHILEICKKINPIGVLSIGSDLAVITVNYVARALKLTCNPIETDIITTNKYQMRKIFQKEGIPSPNFFLISNRLEINKIKNINYPIIVKSTDRSGSRGVTRLNDEKKLKDAINFAIEESFEKKAIIEEYIVGKEYSCECISYNGIHTVLAITEKFTTGYPSYLETGHLQPARISENKKKMIQENVFKALNALNIKFGASHSEFKITEKGEIMFIEIGSRMGGDYIGSDLVELSSGYDFLEMVIDVSVGKKPKIERKSEECCALVKFIFTQKDIEVLNDIKKYQNDLVHYVSQIEKIDNRKIHDSSKRFGAYILKNENMKRISNLIPK